MTRRSAATTSPRDLAGSPEAQSLRETNIRLIVEGQDITGAVRVIHSKENRCVHGNLEDATMSRPAIQCWTFSVTKAEIHQSHVAQRTGLQVQENQEATPNPRSAQTRKIVCRVVASTRISNHVRCQVVALVAKGIPNHHGTLGSDPKIHPKALRDVRGHLEPENTFQGDSPWIRWWLPLQRRVHRPPRAEGEVDGLHCTSSANDREYSCTSNLAGKLCMLLYSDNVKLHRLDAGDWPQHAATTPETRK